MPQQRRFFLSEAPLFALSSCVLGGPKKGGAQAKRLLEALNKPKVALVVGVVAVAVNVCLYFGYYLPRTAPLIEQIQSGNVNKPLPEAISNSLPDAPPESPSGSPAESPSDSPPEFPPPRQQQPPSPQQQQYQ